MSFRITFFAQQTHPRLSTQELASKMCEYGRVGCTECAAIVLTAEGVCKYPQDCPVRASFKTMEEHQGLCGSCRMKKKRGNVVFQIVLDSGGIHVHTSASARKVGWRWLVNGIKRRLRNVRSSPLTEAKKLIRATGGLLIEASDWEGFTTSVRSSLTSNFTAKGTGQHRNLLEIAALEEANARAREAYPRLEGAGLSSTLAYEHLPERLSRRKNQSSGRGSTSAGQRRVHSTLRQPAAPLFGPTRAKERPVTLPTLASASITDLQPPLLPNDTFDNIERNIRRSRLNDEAGSYLVV
ncbi:uncharacterized protein F5Z01DRAFT_633845 [Emericellopsis atlantica]|uniref:Uncharacterized protein n=1 Tax=Emericellopsis atlantica TaxID=2614577 RepID=A0A9P7ZSY5_9HYPO|nr:uncharacterized protein F5Z01DRAFT_633845 [Emericellopsis atlantica]KAG9257073.1 hypothetical protein F5Z01DRAFT_633845 [Emericellopsis atlantica]